MQTKNGFPITQAASAAEWRKWLAENHAKEKSVWLVIHHVGSETESVYYEQAVEEALCFGWIDSKPNKRDYGSYYQYFSKRNPKSNWSRKNKETIARLEAANKLAEPGLEMIAEAKLTGTWTALDEVENLVIPPDLQAAFEQNRQAFTHYSAFPRSVKRGILEWLLNAKRPATRAKRIEETVRLAEQNIRANQYRQ